MCRSLAEGGRRCSNFNSTPAAARARQRLSRARKALQDADTADDMTAHLEASKALTDAEMALERAHDDFHLIESGKPLSAEDRYRVLMNEQRDRRRATQAQKDALRDYVAVSDRFNACLRDPERLAADHQTRAQITEIRRVLKRSQTSEEIVVYRWMPPGANLDQAFLSTTLDPEFARTFRAQHGGRGSIVRIRVPAGARALFINNTYEREVLLDGADGHTAEMWEN
jgi:hypothetical protein